MIDISPFTEEQWNHMCRVNLSLPVPIHELERHKPFIYDRKWGVFYCPFGYHQAAMRVLLGFHRGEPIDPLVMDVYEAADTYLELIQGTAFQSSVAKGTVRAWSPNHLTVVEKRLLTPIDYIGDVQ